MSIFKKSSHIFFALFAIAAISCNNNDQQSSKKINDEAKDSVAVMPVVDYLPAWKNYMTKAIPEFSVKNFSATYNSPWENFGPTPVNGKDLALYKSYLAYNADSSKAVDVYSYNLLLRNKNGRVTAMQGDPDSQINLIDLKNKTSQRIFFTGPSAAFWDAKWIDDNSILVAGTEENEPAYWVINVIEKNVQQYQYEDSITVTLSRDEYLQQKMPGIVFH
jgi:hypothetical protein